MKLNQCRGENTERKVESDRGISVGERERVERKTHCAINLANVFVA